MTDGSRAIYIHIPYCSRVCHYCDFAKTANFQSQHVVRYFKALESHIEFLAEYLRLSSMSLSSIYIGGGTPSLFSTEYEALLAPLAPLRDQSCQVTLEANPRDVTPDRLSCWKELGVNRISLGVQSFHDKHLQSLSRQHSGKEARRSVELVGEEACELNVDLIYGIPSQSPEEFLKDIEELLSLEVHQLSLYHLTFEPRTVLGRRYFRGALSSHSLVQMADFYHPARQCLGEAGFCHEEVSHFLRDENKEAKRQGHNWNYWKMKTCFGVGAGAHGFIADPSLYPLGQRYCFGHSDRFFVELPKMEKIRNSSFVPKQCIGEYFALSQAIIDDRSSEDFKLEILLTSLRTCAGVPLAKLKKIGWSFEPTPHIQSLMDRRLIRAKQDHLIFDPSLWLFENQYIHQMMESLKDEGILSNLETTK